ncbi:MAG: hypothetical protein PGMFKBFP_02399 [Anaerolineales bacterium]|nr:hypothetical protein [Anaerolineales bacterium]
MICLYLKQLLFAIDGIAGLALGLPSQYCAKLCEGWPGASGTFVGAHGAGVPIGDTIGPCRFCGAFNVAFGFGFGTYTHGLFGSYVHQLMIVHVRSIL